MEALKKTTLPKFQFTDARLPELVKFARDNAIAQNAALADVGFLIIDPRVAPLKTGPAATPATASDAAADDPAKTRPETVASDKPAGETPAGDSSSKRGPDGAVTAVSFEAEAMSAWDFLNMAATRHGYRVEVDAKAVRLLHPRIPDGPLYQRTYNVLPTLVDRMVSYREYGPVARSHPFELHSYTPQAPSWSAFFADHGVGWPDGSSVQHMPTIGKLVVVNTVANHRRLEAVLRIYSFTSRQVEIDCQFVAIPREALEKAARSGRIASATILSLVEDGTAKLLASPKVITKNGSEATIKAVVEYIYPTEFMVEGPDVGDAEADENAPPTKGSYAVEPGGFETREVGFILQVVPDVTPDGQMINLTLAPHKVQPPSWKDYSVREGGAVGGGRTGPMEQPFFPVESISTSVQIYDGTTMVIGGGAPLPDGQNFTYLLLTATLIDPAGREMRKDTPGMGTLFPVPPAVD